MKKFYLLFVSVVLLSYASAQEKKKFEFSSVPHYSPAKYVCQKVSSPVTIDGVIDGEWDTIPWTDYFVDIEYDKPLPHYKTRAKMCWDDTYLYVAAYMEEPHIWATIKERDAVIYHDNDFEIFIDPTASTHSYMEFEMNAYGTEWDLFLSTPYRDKGNYYLNSWNMNGMKSAVKCYGTINNPSDKDEGWSVEIAVPWSSIIEVCKGRKMFKAGDYIKMNFSRVEWPVEVKEGKYVKCDNPRTGKINEYNWVWSAQGAIDMHRPEMWGIVMLADGKADFADYPDDSIRWKLRCLYYRQNEYFNYYGKYAETPKQLKAGDILSKEELKLLKIYVTPDTYEMIFDGFIIRDNGIVSK